MADTSLTIDAVVDWIRTAELSVDDRVALVRALRDSTPDLVAVDPRLTLRIRAAQAIDPKYVDTTIIALENSELLQQFASTLSMYRTGILAYYDYRISTGPLEGTNNKIKTMQRQAYGFRDKEFFKLKIYALHEAKYALLG